ncbi:MAG: restriction endonuclease subunit S [Methanoregulaceae archaeon]|jgi:type I restriction enzyme S subunit
MSEGVVKPGYKKTEVGVIPGDWATNYIGQFTDCNAGGTPSTKNPTYWGGEIRWMNSGELNYKIISEVQGRITIEGLKNSSAQILPSHCILIGLAGQGKTRGTIAMNMVELCTNQSIAAILPNDTFVSDYLYYNLDARYDELRLISTGSSGRGGLNLRIIRSIAVPLPPLLEQHAIAAALSDADGLIGALETLIAKKRAIKQAAMQQLLTGRTRLPGFAKSSGYKSTDVGVIPEDWKLSRLKSLTNLITVGFVGSMAYLFVENGIPLLRGINIVPNCLDLSNLKYISGETHQIWSKSALISGDVVIVRVGFPGTACVIPSGLGELNAASLVIVRPNKKILNSNYLCYILNSPLGNNQIQRRLVGGAQQVFNIHTAAEFPVPLPPLPEQTSIATILSDMDAEITALEHRLEKAQQIKQGMMQQLLTGKVRLVTPQEAEAAP